MAGRPLVLVAARCDQSVKTQISVHQCLLAYFVMEFAIFRLLLPVMPIEVRTQFPDIVDVFTQSSKVGFLPRNIWRCWETRLQKVWEIGCGRPRGNRAAPFHSANVIHELTGRDVVSFGREEFDAEYLDGLQVDVRLDSDCLLDRRSRRVGHNAAARHGTPHKTPQRKLRSVTCTQQ
jgi:hypothetical protein